MTRVLARRLFGIMSVALLLLAGVSPGPASAQTVNRDDVLYILPYWTGFTSASDEAIKAEFDDMRNRLGPEGPYVKFGFSLVRRHLDGRLAR